MEDTEKFLAATFPDSTEDSKSYVLASAANWPCALTKAINDPFDYMIGLKNGDKFHFREASYINDKVVHVKEIINHNIGFKLNGDRDFARGIDIFIDSIAWVCDAPNGS